MSPAKPRPPAAKPRNDPAPTVLHVARKAGVSTATVSRVLNGHTQVSKATRARVLRAVDTLGYRLNTVAQGLRKGQTNTVALVVGDIKQGHFAELTRSVQDALEEIGVDLLLFNAGHSQERFAQFVERAASMQLRALVVAVSDAISAQVEDRLREMTSAGTQVIAVSQNLLRLGIPSIVHEERAAIAKSVDWLIAQGRKRIVFLGRIMHSAGSSERYRGYKTAMTRAGLFDEKLVLRPAYRYSGGYETITAALDEGLRFDAVQTASDELAAGALAALGDRRVAVPRTVAVVGIGDNELASYVRPALTTWTSQHGSVARALRECLEGPSDDAALIVLPRELVRRGSA